MTDDLVPLLKVTYNPLCLRAAERIEQLERDVFDREAGNDALSLREQELLADVDRLKHWVADCQSGMYVNCVYCGHRYGPSPETPVAMADVLKQHVEQCPQHPMSALKNANETLSQRIKRIRYAILCARDSYTKDNDTWKFFNEYLDECDGVAL